MNSFWIIAFIFLLVIWVLFEHLRIAPKWVFGILLALLMLVYLQMREVKYPESVYLALVGLVILSLIWRRKELVIVHENYTDLAGMKTGTSTKKTSPEPVKETAEDKFENAVKTEKLDFSAPKQQTESTLGVEDIVAMGDESEDEAEQKKKRKGKPLAKFSPDEAQRATFQLIDTVEQLKTTMETMEPVLRQGASVLSMFDKMKMPALDDIQLPDIAAAPGPADFESMLKVLEKSVKQ
jgi:hypothetical protein